MNTTINFKTDKKVKLEAQKIAKKMGVSLSAALNMYLNQFARDKSLNISVAENKRFSDRTKKDIIEARKEYASRKMKFYSPEKAADIAKQMIK